ncbi:MAG: arylamine N-acetyltransferase [Nannocystis sp.]|nr:arylamine N-acetyltransferase [Nannocystis sp.]MBA3549059.1 arylamine N-acetyltransferase [Nannocystis sp.]
MTTGSQDELFRRYLGILGWVGDPGLHELVSSHLIKVPFENVSKLISSTLPGGASAQPGVAAPGAAGVLPDIETFLEGIGEQDLGGTCFAIALHFTRLLSFLDYEVELLGADVGGTPRSHAVCRVRFEDAHYLVDVGYAAPFYEPISLVDLPARVPHGDVNYVIDRHVSGAGALEVTTFRGSSKVQSYVAKPPALESEGFAQAIERASGDSARFMRSLRISRFFASRVLEVVDNTLVTTHHNITTVTPIRDLNELDAVVHEQMQLPRMPVREAVEILKSRGVDVFARS